MEGKRHIKSVASNLGGSQTKNVQIVPHSPPPKEKANIKREKCFMELLSDPVINLDKIRGISWAGIPDQFRAKVWRLFLDYEPVNSSIRDVTLEHKRNDYFDCLDRTFSEPQRHLWTNAQKQTELQILRDLPRTHSPLLRNQRVQLLFERVLFVWSVRHPASGYVQGMNDLLQPFFFAFLVPHCPNKAVTEIITLNDLDFLSEEVLKEVEADCFWCFSKLLDGLQDLYTKDQPGLYKMLDQLSKVIDRVDPKLNEHLREEEIEYQEFAFRWMNCLLVREFSIPLIFRLWDSYLSNHTKISSTHVYTCAALMVALSPKIIKLQHSDFVMKIQSIDPESWTLNDMEMIIAQAYVYEKMFSHSPSHLRSSSMPVLPH
ncbi:TBC domain containing protein [Histomonas meleagridis]|uniref:TBC domain containing protein n=1 Tax=Histomonas meleagridis TaxID=135588 RepID=UPI003559F668|nr:TBC domain containing protein [Histomonas meleagridis]KAH0802122.1 TBC domain containing protein [Histomonas meleagridis]